MLLKNLQESVKEVWMAFKRRIRFSHKDRQDSPNKETIAAMLEAERIAHDPGVEHYSDVEEALRELKR